MKVELTLNLESLCLIKEHIVFTEIFQIILNKLELFILFFLVLIYCNRILLLENFCNGVKVTLNPFI